MGMVYLEPTLCFVVGGSNGAPYHRVGNESENGGVRFSERGTYNCLLHKTFKPLRFSKISCYMCLVLGSIVEYIDLLRRKQLCRFCLRFFLWELEDRVNLGRKLPCLRLRRQQWSRPLTDCIAICLGFQQMQLQKATGLFQMLYLSSTSTRFVNCCLLGMSSFGGSNHGTAAVPILLLKREIMTI